MNQEIQNKINYLEAQIFAIKIEINSNYLDGFTFQGRINERSKLKKELSHLKKIQKLKKERKQKLEIIYNG